MSEDIPTFRTWKPSSILPPEFELLNLLGEGAYGCVYKATHRTMNRTVAIKFIRKDGFVDEKNVLEYFQKEAKAIARLEHPNIVRVLQVGLGSDNTPFLVYEFLEGETLRSYLHRRKTLSVRSLFCLFSQLTNAVSYAHAQGVVHRDIKPENIMLMPEQSSSSIFHVKLLDFGTAKSRSAIDANSQSQTASTNFAGSPAYASPEQCKGLPADQRSDIYSLSSILYECIIGAAPFSSDSPVHTMYRQINEAPALPDKRLPGELNKLLLKGLAKNPDDRFSDCKDFEQSMRPALKALEKMQNKNFSAPTILKIVLPIAIIPGLVLLFATSKSSKPAPPAKPISNSITASKHISPVSRLIALEKKGMDSQIMSSAKSTETLLAEYDQIMPLLAGKKELQLLAHLSKANALGSLEKYPAAMAELKLAKECCKAPSGHYLEEGLCLNRMALNAEKSKDWDKAIEYAMQSLSVCADSNDSQSHPHMSFPSLLGQTLYMDQINGSNHTLLAHCYYEQKKFALAQKQSELAIQAWQQNSDEFALLRAKAFQAEIFYAQGNKAQAHKEIDEIRTFLEESIAEQDRTVVRLSEKQLAEECLGLAIWYRNHGNSSQAKEIALKGWELASRVTAKDSATQVQLRIILQALQ